MNLFNQITRSLVAVMLLSSATAIAVQPLEISDVFVQEVEPHDLLLTRHDHLTVLGKNFMNGGVIELWLGDFDLEILSQLDAEIMAEMPILIGPGSYQLVAMSGGGTVRHDDFDGVTIGAVGLPGADGLPGIDGVDGTNGLDGAAGATGPAGADGTNGTDGLDGAPGATGAQGLIGLVGPQGIQGVAGLNGAAGSAGTDGVRGLQGEQGLTGAQGIQGIEGTNGVDGLNVGISMATASVMYRSKTLITIRLSMVSTAWGLKVFKAWRVTMVQPAPMAQSDRSVQSVRKAFEV